MQHLLDLGFWLVPPGMGELQQDDGPPVAADDVLSVPRTAGPTTVSVLDNDIDPEGQPLTLVSAYAALGTAVVNPGNTVTYTPPVGIPPGQVEYDTVVYEIADALDQRDTGQINVTIEGPDLQVNVTPQNTLVVIADTAPIDITVSDPPDLAGTYTLDVTDLASGPVNLSPPVITGTAAAGEVLTAVDGLWAHDSSTGPVVQTWQWQREGVDILGETGASYTMQAQDDGPGLSVVETLGDVSGVRSAASVPVALGFRPTDDAALIGWWDADDATTFTETAGQVSQWNDKAGSQHLTQPTGAWRPITAARMLNGRNIIDFDAAQHLVGSVALPGSGDFALHMALEIDSVDNPFSALLALEATNDFQLDSNNASQFDGRLNAAGIGSSVNLSGGPFSGATIVSIVFDRTGANQAEVFVGNGIRATMALSAAVDAASALHIMTNRSRNAGVAGAVAEVVLTGEITNRVDHHTYLAAKWGIS